jgi:hypothetical protein
MNTQIPSGLQALMQASQILQQEAAQTAPGPQGQQPTVASQVQQAASQQMPQQMPNVQQVGQQAGIAAQLMAQRQQQAQDPRAVAQMAAQMLQQKGVASLPTNMQFREGGIIGYAGPDGSSVELDDPEAGLSIAERAEWRRREKGSIYDPYYGYPPAIREAMRRDEEARREGRASPESIPIPGPGGEENIPRARSERESIEAEQRAKEQRLRDVQLLQERREARRAGLEAALPQAKQTAALAGGAKALEEYYVPYPTKRGEMKVTDSKFVEPSQATSASMDAADASIGGIKPAATPPKTPPAPPQANAGIVQALPALAPVRAESPAVPTYPTLEESPEEKRLRQEAAASGDKLLAAKKAQADLEAEGIAALRSSEAERKRLLESKRSRDSFNSFMALVRDLRLRNNEYGAYMASIDARDEADRLAGLANEQAIIKLKEAQQAKALGNVALERELKKEAYSTYVEGRKRLDDAAKSQAQVAAQIFSTQSSAANSMADRANQVNIEIARMAQQAQLRKDAQEIKRAEDLRTRLTALTGQLARSQDQIASALKKDSRFESIESLEKLAANNLPLNDAQKKLIQDFSNEKRKLEQRVLPTINAQLDAVMKELGIEVPQVPTVKFDSSGNRIQ